MKQWMLWILLLVALSLLKWEIKECYGIVGSILPNLQWSSSPQRLEYSWSPSQEKIIEETLVLPLQHSCLNHDPKLLWFWTSHIVVVGHPMIPQIIPSLLLTSDISQQYCFFIDLLWLQYWTLEIVKTTRYFLL